MPLPKPSLDSRRFDQLVAETRALLVRAAPGWTDHNASDPGITLLELFAWLAEQNLYRLDRLSDDARRAFVRRVGIEPLPAGIAATVVAIDAGGVALRLPARLQIGDGTTVRFETIEPVALAPARLASIDAAGTDVTTANAHQQAFAPFGTAARPGRALVLEFDQPLGAPGTAVSLHVWTDTWRADAATRDALQAESAAAPAPEPTGWRRHYRVRTVWEYWSAAGYWRELPSVSDATRALTLTGFVRFAAPDDPAPSGTPARYPVRCRIVQGRFECPSRLVHVALNAVACEHALSRHGRDLGVTRGHAGTLVALGEAPVVAGSTSLTLVDGAGTADSDWTEAADWDRAGAHDRVFRLDPLAGTLQFGDGLRGAIVPAGRRLSAAYRAGGGAAGNVTAGTLVSVPANAVNLALMPDLATLAGPPRVAQPFDAVGGSAPETPALAQARAFDAATAIDKAVTLEDIERLALAAPGVPVARARAIAGRDPRLPCLPAPGCITLVVIPRCPRPAPRPSRALLDAVARYVDARRLVTSEIHTVGPRYRRVAVRATLHVTAGADTPRVVRGARARIDAYFDPVTGGSDGRGWPFGRTVYRSEILALLATTPGVQRVTGLGFVVGHGATRPLCESVALRADELVRPGRHDLQVDRDGLRDHQRSVPHECESD